MFEIHLCLLLRDSLDVAFQGETAAVPIGWDLGALMVPSFIEPTRTGRTPERRCGRHAQRALGFGERP